MEKALTKISPTAVQKKIKYGQGLTAREFAVATGFAYCSARAMFKDPEFPVFRRAGATTLIFWSDWEVYRRRQVGLSRRQPKKQTAPCTSSNTATPLRTTLGPHQLLSPRVQRVLAMVGG